MPEMSEKDTARGKAALYALASAILVLLPYALVIISGWQYKAILPVALAISAAIGALVYVLAGKGRRERAGGDLQQRHDALEAMNKRMQADLRVARGIQRAFLPDPRRRPFPSKIAFAHSFRPEIDVGGDYYDFKPINDHRLALLLADVSGHGMSAAFVTGLIKTAFEFQNTSDESPAEFLGHLNNVLERLTPSHFFASVIYAIYDVNAKELRYANAGHSPLPLIIRADGSIETLDSPVDLLAGVNPEMHYQEGKVGLAKGDKLLLCTDGLPDSRNPAGERFGLDHLNDLLRLNAALPPDALRNAIMQSISAFEQGGDQSDDQTLIIMGVR